MSVRRKFSELLKKYNPFSANLATPPEDDEDLPAAKRPRLETSTGISTAADTGAVTIASGPSVGPSRSRWKPEEDAKLIEAVEKFSGKNWIAIAEMVTGRTNLQCRQRWAAHLDPTVERTTTGKEGKRWEEEEDELLMDAMKIHGKDWSRVAVLVPGRTHKQCYNRWSKNVCPDIDKMTAYNKDKWTVKEDEMLINAVKKLGNRDWVRVAALVPGRTNTECWSRWSNQVPPSVNRTTARAGTWNVNEDAKLNEAVRKLGNDWVHVAAMIRGRTNEQWGQKWVPYVPPNINRMPAYGYNQLTEGPWRSEEDAMLTDAVKKLGQDWVRVATLVPGRTNIQCWSRWCKHLDPNVDRTTPCPGMWTLAEDRKLIAGVREVGNDWVRVAAMVPGRTNMQCHFRWFTYLAPAIDRTTAYNKWTEGPWKPEEDAMLMDAVKRLGEDWVRVAARVPGRTNDQCSSRWCKHLDPNVDRTTARTGKWTLAEDDKLTEGVREFGEQWIRVAAMVPGRTNLQCRFRWVTHLAPTIHRKTVYNKWTAEEDAMLD
jgi:hypothetical protein